MLEPEGKMGFLFKPLLLGGMLLASLALAGCSGDDGTAGADGTPGKSAYEIAVSNGFTGTEAEWLAQVTGTATPTTAEIETCAVCHASVKTIHAATGVETVSNIVVTPTGPNLVFTFNVKVDGVNSDTYTLRRAYVNYNNPALQTNPPTLITTFVRDQLYGNTSTPAGTTTLVSNGNGNYTITVPDGAGLVGSTAYPDGVVANSNYLFQLTNALGDSRPVVVAQNGAAHLRDLVTDGGCANCHGAFPAWSEKFKHYAVGGSKCQMCHSQATRDTTFNTRTSATTFTTAGPIYGTNITEYIHGIHNSHNMPDGVYYRTTTADATADAEDRYSVGFPSAMNNCRVCHTTDAQLTAIAAAPVSYYLCMTCHQNWDGFVHTHADATATPPVAAGDKIFPATTTPDMHRGFTPATNCAICHNGTIAPQDEVADFHNDFQGTDAHYNSYYRGEDISFANNDNVTFAINGVTSNGSAVSFTWTASKLGVAVNPCNTDVATGPTYQSLGAYLAYAKGDDWVNEFVSTTPGQPAGAKNLFTSLATTCTSNVATTTGLTLNASALAYADKVLLAVGGKALDRHAATGNDYFVREASPTYAFNPADGTAATPRRNAVANAKCLACHQGSLYQHGGDRVDNEQLCVICHNPSANDKNNRLNTFQIVNADGTVNTDKTYDGKNAETYDMRTMIHSIHGVSKRVTPWTVYRSRGIYAFVNPDTPKPTGWPADGMTIYGSMNNKTIAHNWTVVHYPKPVNDCAACHNEEAFEATDQTKAVAVTVDPGFDYSKQSDDIVIGPTAAACTACHATAPVKTHATVDFGYRANVTKESMLAKAAQ